MIYEKKDDGSLCLRNVPTDKSDSFPCWTVQKKSVRKRLPAAPG